MGTFIIEYKNSNEEWVEGGYYYNLMDARAKKRALTKLGYEAKLSLLANGQKTLWEV